MRVIVVMKFCRIKLLLGDIKILGNSALEEKSELRWIVKYRL